MNKQDYLDALKHAMAGLAPDTVARTLAYYEQRFIDGLTAGRGEQEIAAELDPPRKIAMTLRANVHLSSLEKKTPFSLLRMLASLIGLGVFNLFMVIPAMVYAALLTTVYACALSFYLGGVVLTASGLSGQNELALEGPLRHVLEAVGADDGELSSGQWRMAIDRMGFQVSKEAAPDENADPDAAASANLSRAGRLLERAEAAANGDLQVTTDFDGGARTSQTFIGLGLVLGGIGLCLISLVLTRYTVIGFKRYVAMNVSLLRGR